MFMHLKFVSTPADAVFLACALIGITLFVLRSLFLITGGLFDGSDVDHHHEEVEPTFKFLTLHTFTGFLMMFGLLGLGLRYQFEYPISVALGLAVLAGLFVMFLVGVVFYAASRLTSQGSVFRISELIGLPAVVYQKITVHEDGKVQVVVRGIVREVTARATSGEIIESFEHVRIVGVVDEHTVLVEKNIQ